MNLLNSVEMEAVEIPQLETPAALLGYSVAAMEAMEELGKDFVAVVPPGFEPTMREHELPFVPWDFERNNDRSKELGKILEQMGVEYTVPLFEETVEWAGAVNAYLRQDARLFARFLLLRDKAMMKRRAQMHGIRVGVFEEAENKDDVKRFLKRVKNAAAKLEDDLEDPVHLKPLRGAGCYGHVVVRTPADAENLGEKNFPCLLETHLDGQEFSCEAFIHAGKVRFLNITEYIHLGHTNFVPASPKLQSRRPHIRKAVEDLVEAFEIEYGLIHPEFFITPDDKVNFGEVAARVPGGHILELISKSYNFNAYAGFALCCDPNTTEEQLQEFFPSPTDHEGYAGCVMVYPKKRRIEKVHVPDELVEHPYYEKHTLFTPSNPKVGEIEAYGSHYGTIYFRGSDPDEMRKLLNKYDEYDFYGNGAHHE